MLSDSVISTMECIFCRGMVCKKNLAFFCMRCGKKIQTIGEVPMFLCKKKIFYEKQNSEFLNGLKTFIKKSPAGYAIICNVFGPGLFIGTGPKKFFSRLKSNAVIINIGSGTTCLDPRVANIDIYPFKGVDIVADASELPFRNDSVDMVISEVTLEHVAAAFKAIEEITRIVKPGGYVYVAVPFVFPFHPSPSDYYRWTPEGIKESFKEFRPLVLGIRSGPMAAFIGVCMHLIALPVSLISLRLYVIVAQMVMILLSPLKLFDLLFRFMPGAIDIAAEFYFVGRKK